MKKISLEAFIWIFALASMALYYPSQSHFTLCPLANLGFHFCPGCGIGHSISYALHGEFANSWHAHPLGFFAIFVLTLRIIKLTKPQNTLTWLK